MASGPVIGGRIGGRKYIYDLWGVEVLQDVEMPLCPGIDRDRLPRLHGCESDNAAVSFGVTESLSSDTDPFSGLTRQS